MPIKNFEGSWGGVIFAVFVSLMACETSTSPCEEDRRAIELGPRQPLVIGLEPLEVEVARTAEERLHAWAYRRCELDGVVLLPDAPALAMAPTEPMDVRLCNVLALVDLTFVRDDAVVEFRSGLTPCADSDCDGCEDYGKDIVADAIVQSIAGELEVAAGQAVVGLQDIAME